MKFFVIAILISCVFAVQAITWDDLPSLVLKCGKRNGLTIEEVKATKAGTNLKDPSPKITNHIVCCLEELKWFTATHDWNVENIKSTLPSTIFTKTRVKKVVKCATKKDTVNETALEFWRCAHHVVGPRFKLED